MNMQMNFFNSDVTRVDAFAHALLDMVHPTVLLASNSDHEAKKSHVWLCIAHVSLGLQTNQGSAE